jgi:hypothetical protein
MRRLMIVLVLPALALAIYDMRWFELNNWRCPFHNDGRWGIDTTQGAGVSGGYWRDSAYVFGGGVWFGALQRSHDTLPDTLTTVGYNPNSGGTECVPTLCRYWPDGYGNTEDRIYRNPGDWPPPLSRFPMAPQGRFAEQDFWCCFSDSDPAQHVSPGRPLGIDVTLGVHAFTGPLADDILFLRYDCFNRNDYDTIRAAYVGIVLDPDIGTNATNDLTGLILDRWFHIGADSFRVRNLGFAYSQDHAPSGVVGLKLLSAPEGVGLSALKRFSIDYDPVTDVAQYMTMAGFDYRTGEYLPYDSIDPTPADKRFIVCTGPFDLAPDSSITLWYAVIGAPFWQPSRLALDTTELALRCRAAESLLTVLTGVAEAPNVEPRVSTSLPTVVRGVLRLPPAARLQPQAAGLLDLSGRKMLDLHPGANDVRSLAPGVYFVRQGPRGRGFESSRVRKVVVTR